MTLLQKHGVPVDYQDADKKTFQVQFSRVEPAWAGRTVVCLATGPSLTPDQLDRVRRARERDAVRVIAINDNHRFAPWADVGYFCDWKWWAWHREAFQAFAGEKVSLYAGGWVGQRPDPAVHYLRVTQTEGLSADPAGLATGANSGHQAINLAVHARAAVIVLLGYDGKKGPKGEQHHFGKHPDNSEPDFGKQLAALRTVDNEARALGIRIVNCSPGSAIDRFEKAPLESVLPDSATAAVPG